MEERQGFAGRGAVRIQPTDVDVAREIRGKRLDVTYHDVRSSVADRSDVTRDLLCDLLRRPPAGVQARVQASEVVRLVERDVPDRPAGGPDPLDAAKTVRETAESFDTTAARRTRRERAVLQGDGDAAPIQVRHHSHEVDVARGPHELRVELEDMHPRRRVGPRGGRREQVEEVGRSNKRDAIRERARVWVEGGEPDQRSRARRRPS